MLAYPPTVIELDGKLDIIEELAVALSSYGVTRKDITKGESVYTVSFGPYRGQRVYTVTGKVESGKIELREVWLD